MNRFHLIITLALLEDVYLQKFSQKIFLGGFPFVETSRILIVQLYTILLYFLNFRIEMTTTTATVTAADAKAVTNKKKRLRV